MGQTVELPPELQTFEMWWAEIPQEELPDATFEMLKQWCRGAWNAAKKRDAKIADSYAEDDWAGAEGARRVAAAIRQSSGTP